MIKNKAHRVIPNLINHKHQRHLRSILLTVLALSGYYFPRGLQSHLSDV